MPEEKAAIDYNIANSSINEAGTYARQALLPSSINEAPLNPGGVPKIMSLTPNTAVLGSADLTVTITGTTLGPWSAVLLVGLEQPTTFIDNTHVSFTMKPSRPGYVKNRPYPVGQERLLFKRCAA